MDKKIALIIIILVAAFLRFSYLNLFFMSHKHDRDIIKAVDAIENGKFPLFGEKVWRPDIEIRLGPFASYLYIFPLSFSRNPIIIPIFVATLNIIAIYFCYKIGKDFFNEKVGLTASLIYATFPLAVFVSRNTFYSVDLIPFFSIFLLYSTLYLTIHKNSIYFIPAMFSLTALTHLHLSTISLILVFSLILIILRPKLRLVHFLFGISIFVILYLPLLYYETSRNFHGIYELINLSKENFGKNTISINLKPLERISHFTYIYDGFDHEIELLNSFVYSLRKYSPERLTLVNFLITISKIGILFFLGGILYLIYSLKKKEKEGMILLLWIFIPLTVSMGFGLEKNFFPMRYLYSLLPVIPLVMGVFLAKMLEITSNCRIFNFFILLVFSILIVSYLYFMFIWFDVMNKPNIVPFLGFFPPNPTHGFSLSDEKNIIELLIKNFGITEEIFRSNTHGLLFEKIKRCDPVYNKVNYQFYWLKKENKEVPLKDGKFHYILMEEKMLPFSGKIKSVQMIKIKNYWLIVYTPLLTYPFKSTMNAKENWYKFDYEDFTWASTGGKSRDIYYRIWLNLTEIVEKFIVILDVSCPVEEFYVNEKILEFHGKIYDAKEDATTYYFGIDGDFKDEIYYDITEFVKEGKNLISVKLKDLKKGCFFDIFEISYIK